MRIRTGFSFRNAVGTADEVLSRLNAFDLPPVISDRASTFGYITWDTLVRKQGKKPIFGVELGVTPNAEEKKPAIDHWTFIAKDSLYEINKLVQHATAQFRYEPILTTWQALQAPVYKIAGFRSVVDLLPDAVDDDCYFALDPAITPGQVKRYLAKGYKPLAASNNRYPKPNDKQFYEIVTGINASIQSYPQWIMGRDELRRVLEGIRGVSPEVIDRAFTNWHEIEAGSNATLVKGRLPVVNWPKTLRQQCEEGAAALGVDIVNNDVYRERLDRELKLIADKNFDDYFQIVGDLVRFAKKIMIVGPARGSSCGSLVCYLLRITTIDPIPHGLIFERFIDINRDDLPDIDIDFSDVQRPRVFDYLSGTLHVGETREFNGYGADHVARLGTISVYKPRSAVNEAGAALKIPKWETEAALDSLIERSSGDARALDTLEDTLRETPKGQKLLNDHPEIIIATRMEGHPRHSGQHAAGVVITDRPILEHVAVDMRTGAAQIDKYDAEKLDLLKIDALGLTQLSVFEDTLDLIGQPRSILESIPLDDPAAFDIINRREYSGIFQFNGIAVQSLASQTKVTCFEDIAALGALARPGPLVSGAATSWIHRKNGTEPITYPDEIFKPYIEDTLGIIVYQEQIMSIGREIGDMTWAEVTMLRKAMSKSLGKEFFDQYGDSFKAGARKKGIPDDVIDKVWDGMCHMGSWAFNKSHSVAYGMISYWCCWLKAHHPVEFAAGTLNHEHDPQRKISLLRELSMEGIEYVAVDKNLSTDKWSVTIRKGKKVLLGPLWNVKGIGPKMVASIMKAREDGQPMPKRAEALLDDATTDIDSLYPISDRVRQIVPDLADINIFTEPTKIGDITEDHDDEPTVVIIGVAMIINPRHENETIKIAKRGFARSESEPLLSLNLQIADDSGLTYCHVGRFKYDRVGKKVVDHGRPGKSIWAVKGKVAKNSRMIFVDNIRYIGDMDPAYVKDQQSEQSGPDQVAAE